LKLNEKYRNDIDNYNKEKVLLGADAIIKRKLNVNDKRLN